MVCIGLYTIVYTHVSVNNVHLISERDDEISNFSPWSAQEEPQSHGNRSAKNHTQRNEVGNIAELFAKRKLDVCQEPGLFSADTAPASNISLLLSLSSILLYSKLTLQILSHPHPLSKSSPLTCVHTLLLPRSLVSLLSDYGVDRSGVWEQRAHQLWWGSQLPEVPPHFLRPQPLIPPHWRRLGLSLQSWPEGETVLNVISFMSSTQLAACDVRRAIYVCVLLTAHTVCPPGCSFQ